MSVSPDFVAFKLAFQISPIILTGGIATNLGGALPIVALTEGANFVISLLEGGASIELDNFFASYLPLPGASLINNQVALYPFANQSVAANAIIAQPLNVSMLMRCPAGRNSGGYPLKLATMTALQNSLSQHNGMGGTYSIVTPSFIYTYCIMTGMRDASGGDSKQSQYDWQLDFMQPLVSIQSAQTALNGLMQKLTDGTPISGTPSWTPAGLAVGNPSNLICLQSRTAALTAMTIQQVHTLSQFDTTQRSWIATIPRSLLGGQVGIGPLELPAGPIGLPSPAQSAPITPTFVDFLPSTTTAFVFQPTLNGTPYIATITWNVFGQRYYITITDLSGNLIVCRALSESGPGLQASLTWASGIAVATCTMNHNVPINTVIIARVSQSNSGFDGTWYMLSVTPTALIWQLATNPNEPVPLSGTVSFDLNLVGGYDIGRLVFHSDTQQFEY